MSGNQGTRLLVVVFVAVLLLGGPSALGDGGTGATSIDNWAKERIDEFEELGEKPTLKKKKQRLALLREFERAPC